jgi:hypothetical protein
VQHNYSIQEITDEQQRTLKAIEEKISAIEARQLYIANEFHAVAATLVPRLRTERDVHDEFYYQEARDHDCDAESRTLDKIRSGSA